MYSFKNDYSEGAHPSILEAMVASNMEQTVGYGEDTYTLKAYGYIKEEIGREDVAIHLLVGGTQVNLTALSAFLRPHEAAIAVESGHIATHETGAIEATGHKVITTQGIDGKLTVESIEKVLRDHTDEHMVKPRLVYISNSTEIGTIYKKQEIIEISTFCKEKNLIFYIDGARLGSALCAEDNDLTIKDLGDYADAFYIGGTKNGALMGEALVIVKESLKEDFRYLIKQKGAMLAKGRVLGIQFTTLFKDGLFYEVANHANKLAMTMQEGIMALGYDMMTRSTSNQIFPVFPKHIVEKLQEKYDFIIWQEKEDENQVIRLVTSWATRAEVVEEFLSNLAKL